MHNKYLQDVSIIKKVVLFGPESTGKTTLSQQLADYFNTVWVPEYPRLYLQQKWDDHQTIAEVHDSPIMAEGQIALENQLLQQANKVLICDTDILEIMVYSEIYFDGYAAPELREGVKSSHYDLYFLTYIDTPWVPDDLRDRPNDRKELFKIFESALIKHNRPYITLKGSLEVRFAKAVRAIESLLNEK